MKGIHGLAAALICFAGCASCGEDGTAGDNNGTNNNGTNNNGTNNNGTNNNGTNNNGTNNNNNPITNNAPLECTPEFEYEDWNVTADRRLIKACSPYVLDRGATVGGGSLLLVDPGVEIRVASDQQIRINDGRIVANGTEADPILFTSNAGSPGPGDWRGLLLTSDIETGTEVSHATFEYGGPDACVTVASGVRASRVTLADVTFRECEGAGLVAVSPGFAELARLNFEQIAFGMVVHANVVGQITSAFTYDGVEANQIIAETVDAAATWLAQGVPYRVSNTFLVEGADDPVLTLAAGLVLQFGNEHALWVGRFDDGGLIVNGTEEEPVVLESASGTTGPGDWLGLRFEGNVLSGTTISNLIVRHAGAAGATGCVTIASDTAGRISIEDSEFAECGLAGVGALSSGFAFASFTGNVFRDSPLGLHLAPSVVASVGPQTYVDVPANSINGGAVAQSGTWGAQDVPWLVRGTIEIQGDTSPVLTLEGGVVLQFAGGEQMRVGRFEPGGLIAQGAAGNPVVFQSSAAAPSAGDWLGIRFSGNVLSGTLLDNVLVEHAGEDASSTRGAITIDGDHADRITIRNSTFNECNLSCIGTTSGGFTFLEVSSNTFQNSSFGFSVPPNAINGITDGQVYDATPANQIIGGTVSRTGTWVTQDVPWEVLDTIELQNASGPVLTIEAGNEFRFGTGDMIRVGRFDAGMLLVNGTAAAPVRFTSNQNSPAPGDWLGIQLGSNVSNGTLLDNIVLEYAGQDGSEGGVTLSNTGTSVTISNSTFSNNLQTDIFVDANSTPTLTNNTFQ